MFNSKKNSSNSMNIDTLIGEQCTLQGNISSHNSVKIDGGIVGHIASEGMVIVGEKGWVKGNIQAQALLVFGRIEGDITVQSLDLKASAHIKGNIDTHTLQIEPGAIYQGSVVMHSQNIAALPDTNPTLTLPAAD